LPFSDAQVQPAAPFHAPTGGTAYDRALTCLTQAVYYEAGYEPVAGAVQWLR
jgi:spore germination cell wall hydrolase CwlJ-like protein